MLLDIIVPHYNESWEVCKPFFDVLKAQKGVDFNDFKVMVVHDGVSKFSKECEEGPVNITQVELLHGGVSRARNFGLKSATSEWIAFCDCDDCYTSIFSLMKIFHLLKSPDAEKCDVIWGPFYMYSQNGINISDKPNSVFIHNKYYRVSFLKEHDIHFNPDLRMSEDSAFNMDIKLNIEQNRVGQINSNEPLYAWCRRPGSITMDFSKWIYNTEGHFDRNLYVLSQFQKHGMDIMTMVTRTITDVYSMLSKTGIYGDDTRLKYKLFAFYSLYQSEFKKASDEVIQNCLAASDRDCNITDAEKANRKPIKEWLKECLYINGEL